MRSWFFAVVVFLALLSVWAQCIFRETVRSWPLWVHLVVLGVAVAAAVIILRLPHMQYKTRWGTIKNIFGFLTGFAAFTFCVVFFAAITVPARYQSGQPYLQGHKYTNVLFLWSLVHLAVAAVFGATAWCISRYKLRRRT